MQQYLSAGPDDYITVIESQGIFGAGVVERAADSERIRELNAKIGEPAVE
jgi:hypothetical protein